MDLAFHSGFFVLRFPVILPLVDKGHLPSGVFEGLASDVSEADGGKVGIVPSLETNRARPW